MPWFSNISYDQLISVVKTAVSSSIEPLKTQMNDMKTTVSEQSRKIDDLVTDRVKREDLELLKAEMRDGFAGVYSREMVDRFQKETKEEIQEIKDKLKEQSGTAGRNLSYASAIFSIFVCLIAILSFVLDHWR